MGKISYENPPLNELVFGVQFASNIISQQNIFAFYNNFLSNEFPKIQEADLIPLIIERPDQPSSVKVLGPVSGFHARKLFSNDDNDILIQIQPDKVFLNWRKQTKGEYPHFDNVFGNFRGRLTNLFSINSRLESSMNQFELTYVDHFHSESLPTPPYNLSEIFTFMKFPEILKNFNFSFSIPQPTIGGNLHVNVKSAIRSSDKKPLIVMETTCRGYLNSAMNDWFNMSRSILFKFFQESITEKMKESWSPLEKS
jgi:uncharacterized protein (TIGR04255 family)